MISKEEFWKALCEPSSKGCWNCSKRYHVHTSCLHYNAECWACVEPNVRGYPAAKVKGKTLALWEWDGKNG